MNFLDFFFGTLLLVVLFILGGAVVIAFKQRQERLKSDKFWRDKADGNGE